jgi:uncharacterized membrane protein
LVDSLVALSTDGQQRVMETEMSVIERVEVLEARTRRMEARLAALEERRIDAPARPVEWRPMEPVVPPPPPPASFAPPVSPPPHPSPSPRPRAPRPELSLEDLLGGRVLAWAGGLSLLAGLLFLLVVAVSRGWIGEESRTALAAATSLGLLVAGVRAYERRGRTDSALAATATGIAGLFASAVVAVQAYELIPALAGLAVAFAVGATATWLAVRWEARGIAALGILGAVSAPVLVGGELSLAAVAFLFLATASAVGVLLWQRWTWLAFASFALATLQWVGWLFTAEPRAPLALAVLIGFGALAVIAAVGFELRTRSDGLNLASHLLLMLNALVLAWAGWAVLPDAGGHAWLAWLAVAHLAVAATGHRLARMSHPLVLAAAGIGIVLADVAFASVVDGLPLVAGWAGSAVAMALIARAAKRTVDCEFALAGLGAHLGLALAHTLVYEAPLSNVGGAPDLGAGAALALVAAACFASARLAPASLDSLARLGLEAGALVLVGYLGAVMLEGPALTLTWAAEAAALAEIARRHRDPLARAGSLAFLGCAAVHALAILAPASALVVGLEDSLAALALLGVAGAALAAARMPGVDRLALQTIAAVATLYLASVELITVFQPDPAIRQQGQALLSGTWALVGVATLVAGLLRDRHELRIGALALLAVTLAKVGLYDLSSLDSMYRVASFVALGMLLLLGAFAWQRLRPEALRDLRDVPPALR